MKPGGLGRDSRRDAFIFVFVHPSDACGARKPHHLGIEGFDGSLVVAIRFIAGVVSNRTELNEVHHSILHFCHEACRVFFECGIATQSGEGFPFFGMAQGSGIFDVSIFSANSMAEKAGIGAFGIVETLAHGFRGLGLRESLRSEGEEAHVKAFLEAGLHLHMSLKMLLFLNFVEWFYGNVKQATRSFASV